ncbi:MAG: hypothetical protein E7001_05780, partial [Coriobacteriaceae bacterium]|nr:hypothetical protein [Coriobacteriaceae bacterium]
PDERRRGGRGKSVPVARRRRASPPLLRGSTVIADLGKTPIAWHEAGAAAGDPDYVLAFDMFVYKIAAKAAEMATAMGGMDALVFTAGIGEHAPAVRAGVADRLAWLGVHMDHARNALRAEGAWKLSREDSPVEVYVIPTDEEYMIASDVERILAECA